MRQNTASACGEYHTETHCHILQHPATQCNLQSQKMRQNTASVCDEYHTTTPCNTLQHTATCCHGRCGKTPRVRAYTSRHCFNIFQKSATYLFDTVLCVAGVLQCVAVCCSALQWLAVCCVQCVAVCCSVLQCFAVREPALCVNISQQSAPYLFDSVL